MRPRRIRVGTRGPLLALAADRTAPNRAATPVAANPSKARQRSGNSDAAGAHSGHPAFPFKVAAFRRTTTTLICSAVTARLSWWTLRSTASHCDRLPFLLHGSPLHHRLATAFRSRSPYPSSASWPAPRAPAPWLRRRTSPVCTRAHTNDPSKGLSDQGHGRARNPNEKRRSGSRRE